jgi:hypothetical protein
MGRDLRKFAGQTNLRLVVGGILLFFIVGIGLIYGFYGGWAAIMGLLCMVLGLTPILMIWFVLWIIDWLTRRAERG